MVAVPVAYARSGCGPCLAKIYHSRSLEEGLLLGKKKVARGCDKNRHTMIYAMCNMIFRCTTCGFGFVFFFSDALLSSLRTAFRAIREQFALDTAMEVVAVLAKLQPPRLRIRISLGTGRETHHERMNKYTPYTFRKDRYLNICNIDMICTLNNLRQNWLQNHKS